MKSNLYIPKKIHVGFQRREDTYTGKLAYVIYEDEKGVLRKKDSWEGWRDKKIKEVVLDNEPTRFVFNKGVKRQGYFGSGRSVMRVYDSRDFEFEISIENLVGILMHSDISKRDIMEECVFAWAGKDLVLLPINSEEYRDSVEYTDKQSLNVSTKDLVKGYLYEKKKSEGHLMYMGHMDFYDRKGYGNTHKNNGKKHIFYDVQRKSFVTPSVATIAKAVLEEVNADYAKIDQQLHKSYHLTEMKTFETREKKKVKDKYNADCMYKKFGDKMIQFSYQTYYNKEKVEPSQVWFTQAEIVKKAKTLSMDFSHLRYDNDAEKQIVEDIIKSLGIDWKIDKDTTSYYYQNHFKITGSIYDEKFFEEQLIKAGFANTLTIVDVNGKVTDWKD